MELQGLRAICVRDLNELARHGDKWNQLALQTRQQLPMMSYAWVASYFEHCLLPGESWICLMAYDGDTLIGVLPIVITLHKTLGFNRPILRTPADEHTFSVDFAVEEGHESRVIPFLFSSLREAVPRFHCLELIRLPEDSPTLETLLSGIDGASVMKEFNGWGAFLRTDGDYEGYFSRLSKKFRANLRQCKNRMEEFSDARAYFLNSAESNDSDFATFLDIESSGWKGQSGTAIKSTPTLLAYYAALVRRLKEAGWLEWHFLQVEGNAVASALMINFGRSYFGIKLGYDETYARLSPGTMLAQKLIERAFSSSDTKELNILGDTPWFSNWSGEKRAYYDLRIYPHRPSSLLIGYAPKRARMILSTVPGLKTAAGYIKNLFRSTRE